MYKRYIIFIFIVIIVFILIMSKVNAVEDLPLLGRVIVIDPGHQGIGLSQI